MSDRSAHSPRTDDLTGIVFAMAVEADAFGAMAAGTLAYEAAGLRIHEAAVDGRPVVWCIAGAGATAARRATRLLIDGHRPVRILSAGFAGGLDPALSRGVIVIPGRAVSREGGPPVELAACGPGDSPAGRPVIVSEPAVIATAAEKQKLAAATGASLVDMETHAVATAASEAGLPCLSVRVISDTAGQDLPREIAALVRPQSGMRRLGTALAAIGRRPRAAVDMWQLWEHAVVDGRSLAAAIRGLLAGFGASRSAAARIGSSADRR